MKFGEILAIVTSHIFTVPLFYLFYLLLILYFIPYLLFFWGLFFVHMLACLLYYTGPRGSAIFFSHPYFLTHCSSDWISINLSSNFCLFPAQICCSALLWLCVSPNYTLKLYPTVPVKVSLFGNKVFADIIKIRLHWIRVCPD